MRFPELSMALVSLLFASCSGIGRNKLPTLTDPVSLSGLEASPSVEGRRVISGRLVLEGSPREGKAMLTIIEPNKAGIRVGWPEEEKDASWIEPGKVYQIELLTTIFGGRGGSSVYDNLLRISDGGRTHLDVSLCQVHRLPMKRQIENGKSGGDYPDAFYSTRKKRFPNDGNAYLLCGSGISHPLWKCPKCEKAYHAWAKRHGME